MNSADPRRSDRCRCPLVAVLGLVLAAGAGAAEPPTDPYVFCDAWLQRAPSLDSSFLLYFPGANGWIYKVGDFSPLEPPDDRSLHALEQLVAALAARGTHLVLVVPPPRGLVTRGNLGPQGARYVGVNESAQRRSYKVAVAALARSGALVPDILAAADAAQLPDNAFFRSQDTHWRAEGAELTAKAVASAIAEAIDLSAFPPRRFVTRRVGEEPYRAKVLDALNEICGIGFKREAEPRYVTEAVDTAAAGTDLLGDAGQPVVLAGTSFSASGTAFNFSGFLSQALAQDVLDVAISGGGLETSMLSYLGSADFRTAPPAVLIWEIRPHELPDAQLVRQLLATLEGECDSRKALVARQIGLRRGLTPLLSPTAEERRQIAQPSYLDLAVGDTALNRFTLRLSYHDFSQEDIEIDLTRAPVAAGHYYFALPTERLGALEAIALRPAVRTQGEVAASVCAATLKM